MARANELFPTDELTFEEAGLTNNADILVIIEAKEHSNKTDQSNEALSLVRTSSDLCNIHAICVSTFF